ncbi:TMEM45A, partial [Cervus elaphus hippelaphus]
MGDFKGHALPGFFFITLGIWWTTKCVLKYAFKKQKRTSYYDSKALFCRIDLLEGIVLAGMALIGILGGQFVPGGPHLILYDYKKDQWVRLLDWHHFTMYLFFGLLGVTNILCSTIRSLPASFSKLMLLNALFVEGNFCLLQSHSWPGNAGHLCAQASGLGHLFDRPDCLHGALYTGQDNRGTSADKPFPASGKLVLAGELGPPVCVPGVCTDDLLSLIVGVVP